MQSPSWAANWFAASQEISRISRNPKLHYRTHKRPPPVPILGQSNPVHIPTSHLLEIHPNIIHPSTPRTPQCSPSLQFPHQDPIHPLSSQIHPNIIHPSTPRSPQWFFPSGSPTKTLYTPSSHPYAPHAKPISFFSILSPTQYWVSSTNHLAPLHSPVTSSLLGPNIRVREQFTSGLFCLQSKHPACECFLT